MKVPFRIATISLAFGLAGALTAAWGAESIINLISQGEAIVNEVKNSKATYEDINKRNKDLAAQGKQLVAEQKQLQQAVADYTKQNEQVKKQIADYKAKCEGKQLNQQQYTECKNELAQVNQSIAAVNAIPAKLKKQQGDFNARATKYNQDTKALQAQAPTASRNYQNALAKEEQWLDQVRQFVGSAAVQPYAQKAGCPDPKKVAKSIDQVMVQSTHFLACLKKIAGTS